MDTICGHVPIASSPLCARFCPFCSLKEHLSSLNCPDKEKVVQEKAKAPLWATDGTHPSQFPNPTPYRDLQSRLKGRSLRGCPSKGKKKGHCIETAEMSWDGFVWKGHPSSLISISKTDNPGLQANFWVPITSGKIHPSRDSKSKQGLIKMARDELFIGLFSHF